MDLKELTDAAVDCIFENTNTDQIRKPEVLQFYESVKEQWDRNRRLSDAQKLALGRIWDRIP